MDVNIPQPFSHQLVVFNELQDFMVFSTGGHGEILEQSKYFPSPAQVSTGQFTDYKRVADNSAVI
jgi:hypothetical protein